jgi:hypothetical protein
MDLLFLHQRRKRGYTGQQHMDVGKAPKGQLYAQLR